MKSSTAYKISKLFYDTDRTQDEDFWRDVDLVFENNIKEICDTIDLFLIKLSQQPTHEVPGEVWYKIQDIAHQGRQTRSMSQKQIRYATLALIGYWDQTDLEFA